MPLETASTIADLVSTNPVGASDTPAALDDHIRLIKTVLKADALVDSDIGVNVAAYSHNHTGTYQPLDGELTALAGLTSAANKVPMFSGSGTATLIDFKDEDNMASNSATAVPSQQSVKAYVDAVETITQGTAVSASGTSVAFTSLPSTVKKISVSISALSMNGTDEIILQLGDSGGYESTGYAGAVARTGAASVGTSNYSGSGFVISNDMAVADSVHGIIELTLIGSNVWVASIVSGKSNTTASFVSSGSKTLSGTLDRLQVTTSGGSNTFDAGTVNIIYQ